MKLDLETTSSVINLAALGLLLDCGRETISVIKSLKASGDKLVAVAVFGLKFIRNRPSYNINKRINQKQVIQIRSVCALRNLINLFFSKVSMFICSLTY